MCGRIEYVVHSREQLEGHYGVTIVHGHTEKGFINAQYNLPPSAVTPVLTEENNEELVLGHWGYRPTWAKEHGKAKEVNNARAETVFEKPYFKSSIQTRRCLIPVTGFFEWKSEGKTKTPFRFHMNGEIFSLGGLYSIVLDKDGNEVPHYAIITTEAASIMAPVHDRMPVIIDKEREQDWISEEIQDSEIATFFVPNDTDLLLRDQISTLVNSPKNNTPDIRIPVVS